MIWRRHPLIELRWRVLELPQLARRLRGDQSLAAVQRIRRPVRSRSATGQGCDGVAEPASFCTREAALSRVNRAPIAPSSALTGTDPLSLVKADPADAREFVIGYAGKQSFVRRRATSALRRSVGTTLVPTAPPGDGDQDAAPDVRPHQHGHRPDTARKSLWQHAPPLHAQSRRPRSRVIESAGRSSMEGRGLRQ
jgi:hypothetical protein